MFGSFGGPNGSDGIQNPGTNPIEDARYRYELNDSNMWSLVHLPQNIQFAFIAEHCKVAPTIAQIEATAMVFIRPYLSPNQPPKKAPNNVPGR